MRLHTRNRFASILANGRRRNRLVALSVMGLACGVAANQAKAQNTQYFTSPVSTGTTYSWDSAIWAAPTASNAAPYTFNWTAGDFPRFYSTGATSYIVTVGADESMAGIYLSATGVTLTINQANGTSGDLNIVSAGSPPYQGFFISATTDNLVINAPIVGAGGVEQRSNGVLALYGNNTYSGGTETTGGQTTDYNNNNSFGTGGINVVGNGQAFVNNGPAGVTIANNVTLATAGDATDFAGGSASGSTPGTNWTGAFTLPSTGTYSFETGGPVTTNVTEISGAIGGTSSINISDDGTMILAGANTYTGTTTVTGPSTLKLGAAGTIANTTSLILAGGTLNPDGFNQAMSNTTLSLTASSTIDFSAGPSTVSFANSSGLAWTGTLNLANFVFGTDAIEFGTGITGLTSAQLADIEVNGQSVPNLAVNSSGFLVIPGAATGAPEPAALPLMGMGGLAVMGYFTRRRKAGSRKA